jgi:hypothetical protein
MSDTSSTSTSTSTSSAAGDQTLREQLGKQYNVAPARIDLDAYNAAMASYYAQNDRC